MTPEAIRAVMEAAHRARPCPLADQFGCGPFCAYPDGCHKTVEGSLDAMAAAVAALVEREQGALEETLAAAQSEGGEWKRRCEELHVQLARRPATGEHCPGCEGPTFETARDDQHYCPGLPPAPPEGA